MKVIIQRVSMAHVFINGSIHGKIDKGLMILVGFENEDNYEDIKWTSGKITKLRIFPDKDNVMNLSVADVNGDILLISQFTLHASTKKGNRPSYIYAANNNIALTLYNKFIEELELALQKPIQTGIFGSDMKVSLINDGPVTIIIDSKNKI